MTLLSIIFVLVLEQLKALPEQRVALWQTDYADFLERRLNGGERRQGITAWGLGVALPALLVLALHGGLDSVHSLLGFIFAVAVLYLTVGLRHFSHFFTDIQMALRMGELERARRLLAEWCGHSTAQLGSTEIARLTIEQGVVATHRHVFAPLFWFVVLGPAGAILYWLSLAVMERWATAEMAEGGGADKSNPFAQFAQQAFQVLEWLPARLTAVTFAIVGDFEDAVYCWRTQASQWAQAFPTAQGADMASGILLSSAAGALGVRLGLPLPDVTGIDARPELGLGDDADIEHLQSAIGLVWRALVLCLLLLALLTLASWVGP
jgi:adenosylcobinamide-phosphate synthase